MPNITINFDRVHPDVEYKIIGKTKGRDVLLADLRATNVSEISANVPDGSWIKYATYWTKHTKWKTEWIQAIVDKDLEYGAKLPKPPEVPTEVITLAKPVLVAAPPPSADAAPGPPVIAEETTMYWINKGYAPVQADKLAAWAKLKQQTPDLGMIAEIIRSPRPEPPTENTLRKQWDDFFKNPSVIKAIGLTPSSIHESFSLVFTNYSIINERKQEPAPGDYISVGLIIAGITLAAATAIYAVMPGLGGLVDLGYIEPHLTAKALSGIGIRNFLAMIKNASLRNPLLALLLVSQADVVFWGPSVLRAPIQTGVSQATGYKITLENSIKNKDWIIAKTALGNLKSEYKNMEDHLDSFPIQFFGAVGVPFSDFQTALDSGKKAIDAYETTYPQLVTLPVTFPKEFTEDDANVEDGDTLFWMGHPEANNRIRMIGIDAHEAETDAGKEEAAYLKSLIQGKQVKILTHEYGDIERTIGLFGRLLGGVFLGDNDMALAMLERFGSSILTKTAYQKKYRWIDWDEYKRVAKAAKGPAVKEFKIYIDSEPSNAKLYIDGKYTRHLTPSNEEELSDVIGMLEPGEHVIKAEKAGKSASVTVNVSEFANPDIFLTLGTKGLEPVTVEPPEKAAPVPPEITPEPVTVEPTEIFKINILSTPSRAKIFVDGIYTHHLTPSDEKELSDVMNLLTPGTHVLRLTKAGKAVEKAVEIKAGFNEPIYLTLEVVGLLRSRESIVSEIQGYKFIIERLEAELALL